MASQTTEAADSLVSVRRRGLRTGYTTGACAAAAALAASMLINGRDTKAVTIRLPIGIDATFHLESLHGQKGVWAFASVIKDAGDDPDVTHGAEIGCRVEAQYGGNRIYSYAWRVVSNGTIARNAAGIDIELKAGQGVGIVTRPGLGIPVNGPAINPVPRRMIVRSVLQGFFVTKPSRVIVEVSVVNGESLALKTLNPRLGILGGLSILGTTGIVRPYSTAAWKASVLQGVDVAAANSCDVIVASTGGRSEAYAKRLYPQLPDVAFVEMGEFTKHILSQAVARGIKKVILAGMIGKLSKIACGHLVTHAAGNRVDVAYLADLCQQLNAKPTVIQQVRKANTARHVQDIVIRSGPMELFNAVCQQAKHVCEQFVSSALEVEVLMFDFEGNILGRT